MTKHWTLKHEAPDSIPAILCALVFSISLTNKYIFKREKEKANQGMTDNK